MALAIADLKGHAKEDSTWKQYETAFARFRGWCNHVGELAIPAKPTTVEMYLGDLAIFTQSQSVVNMARSAISAFHEAEDMPSPSANWYQG